MEIQESTTPVRLSHFMAHSHPFFLILFFDRVRHSGFCVISRRSEEAREYRETRDRSVFHSSFFIRVSSGGLLAPLPVEVVGTHGL